MAKLYKKMIYFKDENLLNGILKDNSIVHNQSESTIAEDFIIQAALPKNKNACFICKNLYYPSRGMRHVISSLFALASEGINWKAQYLNMLPLAQFAYENTTITGSYIDPNATELHHFCNQLDSVCRVLENGWSTNLPFIPDSRRKKTASYCRELLDIALNHPSDFKINNLYSVLFEYWDVLNDWTVTHRLLSDMAILEHGWKDTPEERLKLLSVVDEISSKWQKRDYNSKSLQDTVVDTQHSILYRYYHEFYHITGKNNSQMPENLRILFEGEEISINTLCYRDAQDDDERIKLLVDLEKLKQQLEHEFNSLRKAERENKQGVEK